MVPRRERVPHVPVTAEQIVADAVACFQAGATIVHLHARRPDEEPEWRRDAYGSVIAELRRRCPGLVLCVSTSGRTYPELDKRADVLALAGDEKPDMASLTLGSLNFRDSASLNAPQTIVRAGRAHARRGHPPRARGLRHRHGRPRPPAAGPGRARAAAVREPAPRGAQHGAGHRPRSRVARRRSARGHGLGGRRHRGLPAADERDRRLHGRPRAHRPRGQPLPALRRTGPRPPTCSSSSAPYSSAAVAGRRPATVEETRALLGLAPS